MRFTENLYRDGCNLAQMVALFMYLGKKSRGNAGILDYMNLILSF